MPAQPYVFAPDAFTPEFDAASYLRTYTELTGMTDSEAKQHYERQGRIAISAVPRGNFLKLIPRGARILEIGPGDNPGFAGPNV